MKFSIRTNKLEETGPGTLVVGLPDDKSLPAALAPLDARLDGLLARLHGDGTLRGKTETQEVVHTLGRLPCSRLVLSGLGAENELDLKRLTDWAARTAKRLRKSGVSEAAVRLPSVPGASLEQIARAAVEGFELGSREFVKYKSGNDLPRELNAIELIAIDGAEKTALDAGVATGEAVAMGMTFARELGNEPANVATPTYLADRAQEMAKASGLDCTILGPDEMAALGMGSLLGVARGSEEPARFIVVELSTGRPGPTQALVGKGLTFDSGGISIKPAARMQEMKFDMCGGAAVLGSLFALSKLRPNGKVVGLVPATENLPSGRAVKPGDILRSMSGLTIEVVNTDAEGRLILADALTYARRYKPDSVIDIATLTGAIVIALGAHAMGAMGNDEAFVEHVRAAGMRTGERVWPLPLWREYVENMRGDTADLTNSSNAGGKAITAAAFLSRFAEGMRWTHLDIAGTAWSDAEGGDRVVQGATGSGVRTMVESVLSFKG